MVHGYRFLIFSVSFLCASIVRYPTDYEHTNQLVSAWEKKFQTLSRTCISEDECPNSMKEVYSMMTFT